MYEEPENAEIVLDTVNNDAEANARQILAYLIEQGFVRAHEPATEKQLTTV